MRGFKYSVILVLILYPLMAVTHIRCSQGEKTKAEEIKTTDENEKALAEKMADYLTWGKKEYDEDGWPVDPTCDALGFVSLLNLGAGLDVVDVHKAEKEPGKFYRRPSFDCYSTGGSAASISKDVVLMLTLYLVSIGDLETVERIVAYGEANTKNYLGVPTWVMGEGAIGGTLFTYGIQKTLYEAREYLGGDPNPMVLKTGDSFFFQHDYEGHLAVLKFWLGTWMSGEASKADLKTMYEYAERNPNNALYNLIYAKFTDDPKFSERAVKILLDEDYFPADRLPTGNDRCAHYLWERDDDNTWWQQCPDDEAPRREFVYSGIDYILATGVYLSLTP